MNRITRRLHELRKGWVNHVSLWRRLHDYYFTEPGKERRAEDVANIKGSANISYVAQDKPEVRKNVLLSFAKYLAGLVTNAAKSIYKHCHFKQVVEGGRGSGLFD